MCTSPLVLLRVTFPIVLSHVAFPFFPSSPVVPNCHLGSQTRISAPGGVGQGNESFSLIPQHRDRPGTRAKLGRPPPTPGQTKNHLLYPGLSGTEGRKEAISKPGSQGSGGNLKVAPILSVWPGGGTMALASVYPQASIQQTNCRRLIVHQQQA